MTDNVVRVADLWKTYDDEDQNGVEALKGASIEVSRGEVVALFGKSGSGKSTLLNLIAGLDRPSRGFIKVNGQDIGNLNEARRTQLRRAGIGFVFQFFNLIPTLTAFENVHLSSELAGKADIAKTREILAAVGLEGMERRYPHQLSGGEQQRVAIARAIIKEPFLVLADEPTGNLDTANGIAILELLSSRCRAGRMSLLMATHTPIAYDFADRVLTMVDGIIHEKPSHE